MPKDFFEMCPLDYGVNHGFTVMCVGMCEVFCVMITTKPSSEKAITKLLEKF